MVSSLKKKVYIEPKKLTEHVYLVGGPSLSHFYDCNVYLIDGRPFECVLIDSGCGLGTEAVLKNIREAGFDLGQVSCVVNTHCHYRHAGGNSKLNKLLGYCEVIIHELDAPAVERGDSILTGADMYRQKFEPCKVNIRDYTSDIAVMKLMGFGDKLWISAGDIELATIHTPGHTPGSMTIYGKIDNANVLFAGDIDGPFRKEWDSNIEAWKQSIIQLLELDLDIICAGHIIVKDEPKKWLESLLRSAGERTM